MMIKTIAFYLCLVALVPELIQARVTRSKCVLNATTTKNEESMPLLLSGSADKFLIPVEGKISLDVGEKIVLACPNKNSLKLTNTESSAAYCIGGDYLELVHDIEAKFETINCTKGIRGKPVRTNKPCGNNKGKIIDIGYQLSNQFLKLIEICYDDTNGNNLYSKCLLYGNEQRYASKSSFRPTFSTQGLGPKIPASTAYKRTTQKVTFTQLLGTAHLAEQYINAKSYLSRGHMAADADFLYAPWQYSTYFYVNVAPQWQVINNGNWKALEILSRTAAENLDEYLEIYTGQYQVLSVPNSKNKPTELYLTTNKKIAVPKFVWKILYSTKSRKAIAFVNLNNPFASKVEYICKDVCKQTGWFVSSWNKYSKGFVYCCDPEELLDVVGTGPNLKISGILTGSSKVTRMMHERFLDNDDEE